MVGKEHCFGLWVVKPWNHNKAESAEVHTSWGSTLCKRVQKKPVHLWAGERRPHTNQSGFPFHWTTEHNPGKSESTHTILPGFRCWTEENTNLDVIQGSVFRWKLSDPNFHYLVSAKVCFLIIPQKLHWQQVTLFLGPTPQTCPKNAPHAKSYCFPGWPPTSFPKKATL